MLNFFHQTSRGRQLDIAIGLNAADALALNARIEQINDPNSPLCHQFLTPAEFADELRTKPRRLRSGDQIPYLEWI
jgi:subtilase family serine protease